jgi:hypothetical protein
MQCKYGYNDIVSGKPCDGQYRSDFYWRRGDAAQSLHDLVIAALSEGLYRPRDALYYTTSLDRFCYPPPIAEWMTPQSDALAR